MGLAKAWRFSLVFANKLALLQNQNGCNNKNSVPIKDACWGSTAKASFQRKPISWSVFCGLMLFGVGLISLFTGHVASDLEWYSQRLVKPSLYSKLVKIPFFLFFCLCWKWIEVVFAYNNRQCNVKWKSQSFAFLTLHTYSHFCRKLKDGSRREPIDIWKSKYSKYFYGCSERGRFFQSKFISELITLDIILKATVQLHINLRDYFKKIIFKS